MLTALRPPRLESPLAPYVVELRADLGQRCLRWLHTAAAGDVLTRFAASACHVRPSRETVQVGREEHIVLSPDHLQFVNHGCEPNVLFDVSAFCLVALRDIDPGDEIVYFYPATEWRMAEAFECRCGSPRCLRRVTGAADLPDDVLRGYSLSPVVRRLLHEAGRL
jgi:hypothetical protein